MSTEFGQIVYGGQMKETVLAVLKGHSGRYISGEELSRRLQVSRTAVWKHIGGLRDEGYDIESSPRLGYRLVSVPDLLLPSEVRDGLRTAVLGREMVHYHTADSTNRLARELAANGAPEGTLVVAERQTGGRGRLGREWQSPTGGIWVSLILRPALPPYQAQLFTLLAAVAAAEATAETTGLVPGIKWPNDLLVNGRKLVGILTEVSAEMEQVNYLVLGLGLNANVPAPAFAEELKESATSLLVETGSPVSRAGWLRSFLEHFEAGYCSAQQEGFADMLSRWRRYSVTLGRPVRVTVGERSREGIALDISEQGALLVRTDEGTEMFLAGEVTLRPEGEQEGL
jgi:BirA family transcriptional regulator, biotin operon repressor / biotin---[acetyl-CoA-carboxylase] ligase